MLPTTPAITRHAGSKEPRPPLRRVTGIFAGGVVGAAGVAAFGVIHALAIVPIWDRLAPGLFFAVPSGALIGWSFVEMQRAARTPVSPLLTWGFGLLVWVALFPSLVLANVLRLLSVSASTREFGDFAAIVLTGVVAVAIAHASAIGWRVKVSFAVATCGLLAAGGGPIPIANGPRACGLFLGVTALWLAAGAMLTFLLCRPGAIGSVPRVP
jgi:hypothetical protein